MNRILILSEDIKLNKRLRADLTALGYTALLYDKDKIIEGEPFEKRPDMVIIDLSSMPQLDRTKMCQTLKKDNELKNIPLIALIREDDVKGFDLTTGVSEAQSFCDDFIFANYTPYEIEARLKFIFWRFNKIDTKDTIKIDDLVINIANYEVSIKGEPVELTFKEYEMLKFLATHRGRVFTRDTLLNQVWGYEYFGGTRTVDVHVRRLRSKLGPEYEQMIETVRNVGYRFKLSESYGEKE